MAPLSSELPGCRARRRALFLSTLLLVLFVSELAALNLLTPFDLLFHTWVQEHRTCGLDRAASMLKDWTTAPYATVVLVLGAAGLLAYQRRWQDLASFLLIIGGGALLSEWIKEVVSRPRPSALSFVDYGSSFPSGHATSAVTIFGAIYYIFISSRNASWWQRVAGMVTIIALITMIGYQRIYFTHHWLSDVIGGLFLGTSWLLFVLAVLYGAIGKKFVVGIGAAFGAAFLVLWLFPGYRIPVATPAAFRSESAEQIDLSGYPKDVIEPRQRRLGVGRPPQTIWRLLKAETAIDLNLIDGKNYMLIFAARPRIPGRKQVCRQVEFLLNGHLLKTVILLDGWRDYQLLIEGRKLNAVDNRLTVRFDNQKTDSLLVANLELYLLASES